MPYYVESGITGSITANSVYCCCGGSHTGHSGWYNQTDWATWNGGTQRIECAPGSGINSIRTFVHQPFGCSDCGSGPQKDAVEVHFYTSSDGSGTPVAKVLYFHVDSILVSNNTVYPRSGFGDYKSIGWVPASSCGSCYSGAHTHVATNSGGSRVSGLTDCGDSISCCGTNQFQW